MIYSTTGMSETNDLAIKLFGKTIPLPLRENASTRKSYIEKPDGRHSSPQNIRSSGLSPPDITAATELAQKEEDEELSEKEISCHAQEDGDVYRSIKARKALVITALDARQNPKTDLIERGDSSFNNSKLGEHSETGTSKEKTLKKPDKILPCPRCQSMDTKFCYYNNYNVNQPRHFCKNCQRYWTAGGTMRYVPVGSGRRKNKHASASHCHHLMVPRMSTAAELDVANGVHNGLLGNSATASTTAPNISLFDSLAYALNLGDKTNSLVQNGFQQQEQKASNSWQGEENGEDNSRGPYTVALDLTEGIGDCGLQQSVGKSYQIQAQCIPGSRLPHALNSTQWSLAVPPASFPPFPVSFYPAPAYWDFTPPSPWNLHCIPSSYSVDQFNSGTGPNSLSLGKHSRDGDKHSASNLKKEEPTKLKDNAETSVLVPKTLRIDDPTEAAKSSIWEALGIKNEKANSTHVRSLFKGLQTEGKDKNRVVEPSVTLQANPAAFSRSLIFHECT